MEWFKHASNTSTHDPRVGEIIAKFGVAGYGRYNFLIEYLIGGAEGLEIAPKATVTIKQWAQILRTKQNLVLPFLQALATAQLIYYTVPTEKQVSTNSAAPELQVSSKSVAANQKITVILCNYSKLLPSKASDKAKKAANAQGHVVDKKREEEKRIDQKDKSSLSQNNSQREEGYSPKNLSDETSSPHGSQEGSIVAGSTFNEPIATIKYQESSEIAELAAKL